MNIQNEYVKITNLTIKDLIGFIYNIFYICQLEKLRKLLYIKVDLLYIDFACRVIVCEYKKGCR